MTDAPVSSQDRFSAGASMRQEVPKRAGSFFRQGKKGTGE